MICRGLFKVLYQHLCSPNEISFRMLSQDSRLQTKELPKSETGMQIW